MPPSYFALTDFGAAGGLGLLDVSAALGVWPNNGVTIATDKMATVANLRYFCMTLSFRTFNNLSWGRTHTCVPGLGVISLRIQLRTVTPLRHLIHDPPESQLCDQLNCGDRH